MCLSYTRGLFLEGVIFFLLFLLLGVDKRNFICYNSFGKANKAILKGDFRMEYKTWHEVPGETTWNVMEAEKDIRTIKQLANLFTLPPIEKSVKEQLIHTLYGSRPELEQLVIGAAEEMHSIMKQKDNASGYHLNHIVSGKTVFSLWNNNGKIYVEDAVFDTKEEAEAHAAQYEDANVDEIDTDGVIRYGVYVLDDEQTEMMRDNEWGGEFVADFDTMEEAEAESEAFERSYIVEMPSEEWYVVVANDTSKAVYTMMFPTEIRGLAFLYKKAKPVAWMKYVEYLCAGKEAV